MDYFSSLAVIDRFCDSMNSLLSAVIISYFLYTLLGKPTSAFALGLCFAAAAILNKIYHSMWSDLGGEDE